MLKSGRLSRFQDYYKSGTGETDIRFINDNSCNTIIHGMICNPSTVSREYNYCNPNTCERAVFDCQPYTHSEKFKQYE